MTSRRSRLYSAIAGIVAAIATLGVAEVVALIVAPAASPLVVVGGLVIDLVPKWVKEAVIGLFGTADKLVLLLSLGVLVLLLACVIGILEFRRPPLGIAVLAVVGLVATLAAVTRAEASFLWAVPTVVGMVVGILVLRLAVRRLHAWQHDAAGTSARMAQLSRRGFIGFTGATAGAAVVAGLLARMVNGATAAVNAVRETLTLPAPSLAAPAVPAGADLGIDGVAELFTPNAEFYRIDTAIQVPVVDANTWTLRITGMVEREVEITFAELLAKPLIETDVTLTCVSNDIGGGLIGNARWLGYPIKPLLEQAGITSGADMVLSTSIDGFTAGTPLEALMDDDRVAILAVGQNGDPLPLEHGFPVRMVVAGLYGYVSATKWVTELKVSRFADETAYWTARGWSAKGPIKIGSRIDVPKYTAAIPTGPGTIAGVAWAQHTGIAKVEVRVDKGDWKQATLATAISADTWVQWSTDWDAPAGVHIIEARATDANGKVQSGVYQRVDPDGAEGWHTITVDAG